MILSKHYISFLYFSVQLPPFSKLPLHFPEEMGPSERLPPGPFFLNPPLVLEHALSTKVFVAWQAILAVKREYFCFTKRSRRRASARGDERVYVLNAGRCLQPSMVKLERTRTFSPFGRRAVEL